MAQDADSLLFSTLIHMITIKLISTNYLLWKKQIVPILSCQNLLGYIDGTKPAPSPTTPNAAGPVPNRAYDIWHTQDQRLLNLLLSSLTEESMAEVIGCSTSQVVWLALEAAFNHSSKSRELRLKDNLQLTKKGNRSVSEYGHQFKSLCDQLAVIGRPVDDTDKAHWFLRAHLSPVSLRRKWLSHLFLPFMISSPRLRVSLYFKSLMIHLAPHQSPSTVDINPRVRLLFHLALPIHPVVVAVVLAIRIITDVVMVIIVVRHAAKYVVKKATMQLLPRALLSTTLPSVCQLSRSFLGWLLLVSA